MEPHAKAFAAGGLAVYRYIRPSNLTFYYRIRRVVAGEVVAAAEAAEHSHRFYRVDEVNSPEGPVRGLD